MGLSVFVFLFSCKGTVAEQPGIPEDKMVHIMADLNIAEAATNNISGKQRDSMMQVYFSQVYELHGITEEEYEKDLRIYASDLDRIERMTDEVDKLFNVDKKEK